MTAPAAVAASPSSPGSVGRDPLATRRPVGTFVALVVLAGLVLGALSLTGAVAPRLEVVGWSDGTTARGERVWTVEVFNTGVAPVDVEAVTWPTHGVADVELLLARPGSPGLAAGGREDDAVPFAPFTLAGGETQLVMVRGTLLCPPGALAIRYELETLTLRVRSAVGRRQSIDVGPGPFGSRGSDPTAPEPCP